MTITKIGMPALLEFGSVQENREFALRHGFNLLEVNLDVPYVPIESIRSIPIEEDFHYSIHLPEALNVWSTISRVRQAYLDTVREILEAALERKIGIINMHMNVGVRFNLPDRKRFLHAEFVERYLEYTSDFLELVEGTLAGTATRLCIENTGVCGLPFIEQAMLQLLESDSFGLTWDVGHDHSAGYADRDFMVVHKDRVTHLHLHDAIGGRNHLALGDGEIELQNLLQFSDGHRCSVILETKTSDALLRSLSYFRGTFQKLGA